MKKGDVYLLVPQPNQLIQLLLCFGTCSETVAASSFDADASSCDLARCSEVAPTLPTLLCSATRGFTPSSSPLGLKAALPSEASSTPTLETPIFSNTWPSVGTGILGSFLVLRLKPPTTASFVRPQTPSASFLSCSINLFFSLPRTSN